MTKISKNGIFRGKPYINRSWFMSNVRKCLDRSFLSSDSRIKARLLPTSVLMSDIRQTDLIIKHKDIIRISMSLPSIQYLMSYTRVVGNGFIGLFNCFDGEEGVDIEEESIDI